MCLLLGLGICIPVTGNASDIGDATLTQQQSKITASGVVVDESGESLIGASVIEKGAATNGTITDIDGRFSLSVAPNAILEISYVGYQKQDIPAKKDMRIIMHPDVANLEEVVVVAYGTQKKVNLTGAVSQVTAEVLENRSTSSVTQMLQGAMPNVNIQVNTGSPGAGGTISIRGMGSVNSSSPLILVDGIPGSIDQLNPNDIESISVLKDASSAAIYGARAAFGVVLVTTKKLNPAKPKFLTTVIFRGQNRPYPPISSPPVMTMPIFMILHTWDRKGLWELLPDIRKKIIKNWKHVGMIQQRIRIAHG